MRLVSKEQWTENLLLCIWGYFILRATGRSGTENKLWFSINGLGRAVSC